MDWIVRFFKSRFGRVARSYNHRLRETLSRLVPREEFLLLCKESSDLSDLFERTAHKLNVDEIRLLSACAAMMNLEVIKRIPPVDINILPIELTIDRCREMLLCPIVEGDALVGYAVADPGVMRSFVIEHQLPLRIAYVATPKQILSALVEVEHRDIKKREHEQCVDSSKTESVLREVAHQAIMKGADEIVVFEENAGLLCYEASSQGRLVGKGKISSAMRNSLSFWFAQHASDKVAFDITGVVVTVHVALGFGDRLGILKLRSDGEARILTELAPTRLVPVASSRLRDGVTVDALRDEKELPHVLVVEDNPTLSRLLDRLLVTHGYQVTVTPHGGVALELIEHGTIFDAAICDIHMPKIDGLQFIESVRARALHLPILVLTSDVVPTVELRVLSLGADVFLTKDVDPELLLAHLKRRIIALKSILACTKKLPREEVPSPLGADLHDA